MASFESSGYKGGFLASGALSAWRIVRLNSSGLLEYAAADSSDALGVLRDSTFAANDVATVDLFSRQGTHKVISSGTINPRSTVYLAASGKVSATGTVKVGFYWGEERGLTAAANDEIEILSTYRTTPESFARSAITEDALAVYRVPLSVLQATGTGAQLGSSAGTPSGAMGLTIGTFGSASPLVVGEAANTNSKTDYARLQFALPVEYLGGSIKIRVTAKITAAANTAQTIDVSAYLSDDAGGVGSDLVTTAAQSLTTSFANYDFVVTETDLEAGNLLDIQLTGVANDTGGSSGNKIIQISQVALLLDVNG